MVVGDIEVWAARPDEIKDGWEEMESLMAPQADRWLQAIEAGTNAVLMARKRSIAKVVGTVTIKLDGASVRFPEVVAFLKDHYFDEPWATPNVYGLEVQENFRRQGIGTRLMEGAEKEILRRPEVANRVALTVRLDNVPAIQMYKGLGYVIREEVTLRVPGEWSDELNDYRALEEISYIMTKDL